MRKLFFAVCFYWLALGAQGQSLPWQAIPAEAVRLQAGVTPRAAMPASFFAWQADYPALTAALETAPWEFTEAARRRACVVELPGTDGQTEPFNVWRTAMLDEELAAAHPYVRTYAGESLRRPGVSIRFSTTARGFRAMVLKPDAGVDYIEPYAWGQQTYYIAFDRRQAPANPLQHLSRTWVGDAPPPVETSPYTPPVEERGNSLAPVKLRVYRFQVATTGEFAQDHGGTHDLVFSAVVEYTNMTSGIFERDADLRLQLIGATQGTIFLNPATDPFMGELVENWMATNPAVMAQYSNPAAFDLAHVYARYITGGAIGVAGGITCTDSKARGCTAGNGDMDYGDFFVSVIGQEVGHQMSAGHTWNRCGGGGGRAGLSAFEPGSGSTIMSYAGACGSDNIQNGSDLYFHGGSIEEFHNFYFFGSGAQCGQWVTTTNTAPEVTLPYQDNFFIPIGTPFELNGSATDPDGDPLSYRWEEMDLGPETPLAAPVGNAPIFRPWPAVDVTNRYFPRLSTILTNGSSLSEQLPAYTRDMTFRLVALDNKAAGGGVGWATVAFKATADAGPFRVTAPNGPAASWNIGEYVNVTWDVANTDKAPVNCKLVNIRLSTDGGQTYPHTLASNIVNDGSHYVQVPNLPGTQNRIRIDAAENVFFDISNAAFPIKQPTQPSLTMGLSADAGQMCLPQPFVTQVQTAGVLGFSNPISLDVVGDLPPGASTSFSAATINPGESATFTVDLSQVNEEGTFTFSVRAQSQGSPELLRPISITLVRNDFSQLLPLLPTDGSTNLDLFQTLRWNAVEDAEFYDVQVATSPTFNTTSIVASKSATAVDTFRIPFLLEKGTPYFWRIRPRNECGTHAWTAPAFFSTFAENCTEHTATDLPKNITGSQVVTVESKITVVGNTIISDINVAQLKGSHEFFNQLDARLISPQGTEVILFKNRCGNTGGAFNMTLDDASLTPFACPPNGGSANAVKPQAPLSAFNGQNANGVWTLRVKDGEIGSGGKLEVFKLEICASVALNPPTLVNNNPMGVPTGLNKVITSDRLLVNDPDNGPAQLVYTLLTVPKHGELQKSWGGALQAGAQFSQADIDAGALRYFHYGGSEPVDGFRFMVTDGAGGFLGTPEFVILPGQTVSAGEPALAQRPAFQVQPNPADARIDLVFEQPPAVELPLRMFDLAGRLVLEATIPAGIRRYPVDVMALPDGLFAVWAGQSMRKVVIMH